MGAKLIRKEGRKEGEKDRLKVSDGRQVRIEPVEKFTGRVVRALAERG